MRNTKTNRKLERRGAVVVMVAILLIPLLAMVAFAVDYGYLLKTKTDLQRMADAAALAAVQSLIPAADGSQDLASARATLRSYATSNTTLGFQVLDSDIEIGRYDPSTIYSNLTLLSSGTLDTVRVTVRYDSTANSSVSLFFSRALDIKSSPVTATATAVLQKASIIPPGAEILPFVLPQDVWNAHNPGDSWSIYGDGKMTDLSGRTIPGNWGTVDIGSTSNSTAEISGQILDGLRQSDLDALYADGRIPQSTHIDGNSPAWMQGDPGLSSGMKAAVKEVTGTTRLIPIYDALAGPLVGNNVEIKVVGWGVIQVVTSNWGGAHNTYVTIQKAYTYDGDLRPNSDLSDTTNVIENAFTSPVLVE
jgi:Flp pilus assembly protein TadG